LLHTRQLILEARFAFGQSIVRELCSEQASPDRRFDQENGILNRIALNGVEKESPGINVNLVGDLGDVGEVKYCTEASTNILSFATMSDAGADITRSMEDSR
jgi:hypothetical protein